MDDDSSASHANQTALQEICKNNRLKRPKGRNELTSSGYRENKKLNEWNADIEKVQAQTSRTKQRPELDVNSNSTHSNSVGTTLQGNS